MHGEAYHDASRGVCSRLSWMAMSELFGLVGARAKIGQVWLNLVWVELYSFVRLRGRGSYLGTLFHHIVG